MSCSSEISVWCFYNLYGDHRDLPVLTHSFPTRRASDLLEDAGWTPSSLLDAALWRRLPLLGREDIQTAGTALHSTALPKGHGRTHTIRTSGSTGKPVTVVKTAAEGLYWHAFVLRDHLWHGHDFRRRMAVIPLLEEDRKSGV